MVRIVLIGFGAGAAAALLFAVVASGAPAGTLLFYLSPLPILIAALGWSHWAGLAGALIATAGLAAFGVVFAVAFLVGVGLPSWWLAYLALLARPVAPPDEREWYPVGRLVLWAALISALIVAGAMLTIGTDRATVQAGLRDVLSGAMGSVLGAQLSDPADVARIIDIMVVMLPAAAAVSTTLISVLNLWLAGRIVNVSGRLQRPWPSLPAMRLPILAPALLGTAIAGSFLPNIVGIAASTLAAGLMIAHVLLGLAVIHTVTMGLNARVFILGGIYAAVVVFSWPVSWPLLLIGLIGITDALFDLRGLIARKRGPPATRT